MIILKIIGWVLYIALEIVIGVVRIVLAFVAACVCFGGSVFCTVCDIIGFVLVITSLLCPSSGTVTVKKSRPMFFFGVALGAVPAFITNVEIEGIYVAKGLLSKI